MLASLGAFLLTSCATTTPPSQVSAVTSAESFQVPPTAPPVWYPEPVVRNEVLRASGNGRYRVGENIYATWHHVDSYVAEGTASWRGREFDGRQTLSGEEFDVDTLTAAHRNLPLPSYVKVTNLANGLDTIVRVVDRGPFWGNHILDLSESAALKLGFGDVSWRPVRIELVTQPSARYALETNYLFGKAAADAVFNRFAELNLSHLSVNVVPHQYENRYRVVVRTFANTEDAKHVADWLQASAQLQSTIIRE